MDTQILEPEAVIGFKGSVRDGLVLHPDNEHLIFPLGCTLVVRNVIQRTQTFLTGHDNTVNCIAVSPSGRYLASGQVTHMGFNADIIIWDFEQRKEVHRLTLHKVEVKKVVFSPDEQFLATIGGQDDNSLVLWNVETGQATCGTAAGSDTVETVTFFHNSSYHLVTAGKFHVKLWEIDVKNRKLRGTTCAMGALKRVCTNVVLDHEDKNAYVGTANGELLEVNLERCIFKRTAANKTPLSMGITATAILANGDIICGTGTGYLVKFTAGTLMKKTMTKIALLGAVTSITLTADSTHMFVGTDQSNMYWADAETLEYELRNTCHFKQINTIIFPKNYSGVFATSSFSDVRVWNAQTRHELLRIQVPNTECHSMDFMPDGKLILTGWSDGKIRAFLPQSGRLAYVINDAHYEGVTAVRPCNSCMRMVSGGMQGEVRVWRLGTQSQSMEGNLKEHRSRVYDIAVTRDDRGAFTASADGSCILWDLISKTRSICLFESTQFKSLIYSMDEAQVLTAGSDRRIAYWDVFDGQAIRILEGSPDAEILTLAMSKSGSHFASGSADRLVKLWDYDSGMPAGVGAGHSGTVNSVAIAPDQKTVVSVGGEGAIFIWTVPEEAQERMCAEDELAGM